MHALIRATIIPQITQLIQDNYGVDALEALDMFYTSRTAACLADDQSGLYGQSTLYNYGLFVAEKEFANQTH